MKYLTLLILFVFILSANAQSKHEPFTAQVEKIVWVDSCYVLTAADAFEDGTFTGIHYEYYASKEAIAGIKIGAWINFGNFKPNGNWLYKDMYMKR